MKFTSKTILKFAISWIILYSLSIIIIRAKGILPQPDPYAILVIKGFKAVKSLRGKNGEHLGEIYVKGNNKYKGKEIFKSLLVVKAHGLLLDTLYQIASNGNFINSFGKIELKNYYRHYYGFKLYKEKKDFTDYFSIGDIDLNGKLPTDDNRYYIDWDYKLKRFVYDPAP
jgi:hypothetical protein